MIVTCISDTHEQHRELSLPGGDLLIHAGDVTLFSARPSAVADFNEWLGEQPYRYKVVVPGNHDTLFCQPAYQAQFTNASLLINSGLVNGGLRIWGSPATNLNEGAFALPYDEERAAVWGAIPVDTDILITHIPPAGILDGEPGTDERSGCDLLRREHRRIHSRLHVFGHVHGGAGIRHTSRTVFVNASVGELDREPVTLRLNTG